MAMRRWLTAITLLAPGLALAGCKTPGRVIEELPPPYYHSRRQKPAPSPPPPSAGKSITDATVVVDAGHGGKDPGALARFGGEHEKTIVLAVAKAVARGLADRGASVVTTRDRDVFVELDDRAATAERTRADLFISIHADAAPRSRSSASGATFYIARNASPESLRAALRLDATFKRAGIETRGVHRAGFRVLVGHSRPAVLIECGFLTNPEESRRLNSTAYRAKLAAAVVDGVADYFSR